MAGNEVTGANSPTLTIPATTLAQNGQSVTVAIHSNFGDVTSTAVTLTVEAPAGVAITTQPASQSIVVGQSATFTVVATGSPQLNYQWFVNGAQVQNGPQPSYTTSAATVVGTASVSVIVSNPVNQVQSATATLTINAAVPVSITTGPMNQMVAVGLPVQFSAVVAGSAPYTYQWLYTPKGGTAAILTSGTTSSTTIPFPSFYMAAANVGAYSVTVNNAAAVPVTSAAAQLTLAPPGVNLALNKWQRRAARRTHARIRRQLRLSPARAAWERRMRWTAIRIHVGDRRPRPEVSLHRLRFPGSIPRGCRWTLVRCRPSTQ